MEIKTISLDIHGFYSCTDIWFTYIQFMHSNSILKKFLVNTQSQAPTNPVLEHYSYSPRDPSMDPL